MRCFCCDCLVSPESLDVKTGRYYCGPCFEATIEVQLLADKLEVIKAVSSDWEAAVLDLPEDVYEDFNVYVEEESEDTDPEAEGYNG